MTTPAKTMTRIRAYVERGERISAADCSMLCDSSDLIQLALLARIPRERRFGRMAFLNGPVVPVPSDFDGKWPDHAVAILREIRTAEIDKIAHAVVSGTASVVVPLTMTLRAFNDDPDGAIAAIRAMCLRLPACVARTECETTDSSDDAPGWESRWSDELSLHRALHAADITSTVTIAYGPIDDTARLIRQMTDVRELQDETTGVIAVVLAPAVHPHAARDSDAAPSAFQTLRTVAAARIFLDNVPHIVAPANLLGLEIATLALSYGADTIGSVVTWNGSRDQVVESGQIRGRIIESRWSDVMVNSVFEPVQALASARP